jgi:hypothetical protein
MVLGIQVTFHWPYFGCIARSRSALTPAMWTPFSYWRICAGAYHCPPDHA